MRIHRMGPAHGTRVAGSSAWPLTVPIVAPTAKPQKEFRE